MEPYIKLGQRVDGVVLGEILDLVWSSLSSNNQQSIINILDEYGVEYVE